MEKSILSTASGFREPIRMWYRENSQQRPPDLIDSALMRLNRLLCSFNQTIAKRRGLPFFFSGRSTYNDTSSLVPTPQPSLKGSTISRVEPRGLKQPMVDFLAIAIHVEDSTARTLSSPAFSY